MDMRSTTSAKANRGLVCIAVAMFRSRFPLPRHPKFELDITVGLAGEPEDSSAAPFAADIVRKCRFESPAGSSN